MGHDNIMSSPIETEMWYRRQALLKERENHVVRSKYLYSSKGDYQSIIPHNHQYVFFIIEGFGCKSNYFRAGDVVCGKTGQSYSVVDIRHHGITTISIVPIKRNFATTYRAKIDIHENEWVLISRMFREGQSR